MKYHTMGRLQKRILRYLAHNPNQNIQVVKKALKSDYKSVHTAVKRLAQYKLLESRKGESQKRVKIDLWRLSEAGVFYVIASDIPNVDYAKLFENYGQASRLTHMLLHMARRIGKEEFTRFVKTAAAIYLSIGKTSKTRRLSPKNLFLAVVGAVEGWAQTEFSQDVLFKIAETISSNKEVSEEWFTVPSPYSLEVYPIGLLRLIMSIRRPLLKWEGMKYRFAEKLYQNNWPKAKEILEEISKDKKLVTYRLICSQNNHGKCGIYGRCNAPKFSSGFLNYLLCPKVKQSMENFLKS